LIYFFFLISLYIILCFLSSSKDKVSFNFLFICNVFEYCFKSLFYQSDYWLIFEITKSMEPTEHGGFIDNFLMVQNVSELFFRNVTETELNYWINTWKSVGLSLRHKLHKLVKINDNRIVRRFVVVRLLAVSC